MIRCQIDKHTDKIIQGVCLDENCKGRRPICFRCIEEDHKNHKDRKDFQDLGEWLNGQNMLYEEIKNILLRCQQQINEIFTKTLRLVEECRPPINLEDLNNLTYTRLDEKIKNIIALKKLKPVISETLALDEISKTINLLNTLSVRVSQILDKEEKKPKQDELLASSQGLQSQTLRYISEQKSDKEFYFESGIELLLESKSQEAIVEFDRSISIDNGYLLAHKWKAYALLQIGQDAEAAKICKYVFTFDKYQARAYLLCGQALYAINDLSQAQHSFKKALQICPDNKKALIMLAKILFRQDKYEEAIIYYESSLKIDEKLIVALEGIIQPLINLKRIEQAWIYYHKLQKLEPYNKQLINLRQQLEKYLN